MELNNELLNRVKNDVAKEFQSSTDYKFSDTFLAEVCLRYAEAVNIAGMAGECGFINQIVSLEAEVKYQKKEIERLKVSRQKSCEASLRKAADNANAYMMDVDPVVSKGSITDPSNIVIIA